MRPIGPLPDRPSAARPARPLLAAALALAAGAAVATPAGTPRTDRDGAWTLGAALATGAAAATRGLPGATAAAVWLCLPLGALRAALAGPPELPGTSARPAPSILQGVPLEGAEAWTQPGEGTALLAALDPAAPLPERALWPATGPATPARARSPLAWFPHPDEVVRLVPAGAAPAATSREGPVQALVAALRGARESGLARLAAADAGHRHMGLLAALLLGDRSEVDPAVGEHFTRTGTRHLLALSGLHVGLVAWLLGRPLARALHGVAAALLAGCTLLAGGVRRCAGGRCAAPHPPRLRAWPPAAFLALLALAFIPLAGSGAPAARAAVALAVAALGDLVGRGPARGRRPDTRSLWGLALGLEVLARPHAPLELGVQLSYGATLALVLAFGPVRRGLAACLPNGGAVAPVDRAGRRRPEVLRVGLGAALGFGLSALAVGAVATLATLPFTWARFGEWSPVGAVATPLVMPAVTLALAAGYAWLAAPALVPLALPDGALEVAVRVLAWCDGWPGTPWLLPPTSLAAVLPPTLCALALASSAAAHPARARALGAAGAALWFGAVGLAARAPAPVGLEVVQLDVGQGSATVLRAPGAGVWLVDAGTVDRAGLTARALGPLLRAWGARDVSVVLTAPDRAHGSALPWLASRFRVPLWLGAPPEELAGALATPARPQPFSLPVARRAVVTPLAGGLLWRAGGGLELALEAPAAAGGATPRAIGVRARWQGGPWQTLVEQHPAGPARATSAAFLPNGATGGP